MNDTMAGQPHAGLDDYLQEHAVLPGLRLKHHKHEHSRAHPHTYVRVRACVRHGQSLRFENVIAVIRLGDLSTSLRNESESTM